MLQILHRQLPARLTAGEAQRLQHSLHSHFPSLLAGVRLEYLRRLGLEDEPTRVFGLQENSRLLGGEVFPLEPGTIAYLKVCKEDGTIEAGVVSNQTQVDSSRFFEVVQKAAQDVTGRSIDWHSGNDQQQSEPEDARPVSLEVSEKELEAAGEFLNQASKDLLHQLYAVDSLPLSKLKGGQTFGSQIQHLEDLDLVRKDYALLSKETGQQILKVASRESLESSTFFSAENVDEVLSCTPFCRSLMDNDQWLLVLVLGQLRHLGFGGDQARIHVVQQEHVPTQVFVKIHQQRFLLVLTHQKLTIDESYLVSAQIAACQLEDVILVSTQRVSNLMRSHLKSTNPGIHFHFVDGISQLPERLNEVFTEKQRTCLKGLLESLSDLTPVKLHDLVVRKLVPIPVDEAADASMPYFSPALSEALPEFSPSIQQDYALPEPSFPTSSRQVERNEPSPLDFSPEMPKFEADFPDHGLPEELEVPNYPVADRMPPVPLPVDDFPGSFGRAGLGSSRSSRPTELPLE
ncbi:hypothetical protein IV102_38175 [bacterium]|nr:hypothetical protein [bacterium]